MNSNTNWFSFIENSIKGVILRFFVLNLYRISFNLCNRVLFQNREDISFFVDRNIIPKEKAHLIEGGSGVNISEYKPGVFNKIQMDHLRQSLEIRENSIIIKSGISFFVSITDTKDWGLPLPKAVD